MATIPKARKPSATLDRDAPHAPEVRALPKVVTCKQAAKRRQIQDVEGDCDIPQLSKRPKARVEASEHKESMDSSIARNRPRAILDDDQRAAKVARLMEGIEVPLPPLPPHPLPVRIHLS